MKDASRRSARSWARTARWLGVALISFTMLVGAAVPAAAAELMRVTFVRHGQSAGNASGLIDTSTPGPVLTQLGQAQAQAVPGRLGVNNYDGVYASTMVRTQLTAAPTSQYLRLPIQVLPGLQEIEAGVFEGTPESEAANGYAKFPLAWAFAGQRDLRIPGSINGHEFDARVDGALKNIYDNGDRNAIVFSHGGAIMFWTMMNAKNLTTGAEDRTAEQLFAEQHRLRRHRGQRRGWLDLGGLERSKVQHRADAGRRSGVAAADVAAAARGHCQASRRRLRHPESRDGHCRDHSGRRRRDLLGRQVRRCGDQQGLPGARQAGCAVATRAVDDRGVDARVDGRRTGRCSDRRCSCGANHGDVATTDAVVGDTKSTTESTSETVVDETTPAVEASTPKEEPQPEPAEAPEAPRRR